LLQGSIGLDSSAISLQKFQGLALKPLPREFLCENCDSLLHRVLGVTRKKARRRLEAELEIGREGIYLSTEKRMSGLMEKM